MGPNIQEKLWSPSTRGFTNPHLRSRTKRWAAGTKGLYVFQLQASLDGVCISVLPPLSLDRDETGPRSDQPAQFSTLIPRCPRNTCLLILHKTLKLSFPLLFIIQNIWGGGGLMLFVPSAQFTKDECGVRQQRWVPGVPPLWCSFVMMACLPDSAFRHCSLCLGAEAGGQGWESVPPVPKP